MTPKRTAKQHQSRIQVLLIAGAIALLGLGACSEAAPPSSAPAASSVPNTSTNQPSAPVWVKLAQHSGQIYSLARAGNWEKASLRLDQLKRTQSRLAQDSRFANVNPGSLDAGLQSLEQAVGAKDAPTTMQAATDLVAKTLDLAQQAQPSDWVEVIRLSNQTRSLELATIAQNSEQAAAAAQTIQQAWEAERSKIATTAAEPAQQMDQVVEQMKTAQSIEDYQSLVPSLAKSTRALEKSLTPKQP